MASKYNQWLKLWKEFRNRARTMKNYKLCLYCWSVDSNTNIRWMYSIVVYKRKATSNFFCKHLNIMNENMTFFLANLSHSLWRLRQYMTKTNTLSSVCKSTIKISIKNSVKCKCVYGYGLINFFLTSFPLSLCLCLFLWPNHCCLFRTSFSRSLTRPAKLDDLH